MLNCSHTCLGSVAGLAHQAAEHCLPPLRRDVQYWRGIIAAAVASDILIKTGVLSLTAQLSSAASAGQLPAAGEAPAAAPASDDALRGADALFSFAQRGTVFAMASRVTDPASRRAVSAAVARRLVAEYAALHSAASVLWPGGEVQLPCSVQQLAALVGDESASRDKPAGGSASAALAAPPGPNGS